jgi:predicted transposase YbfD/YdcC
LIGLFTYLSNGEDYEDMVLFGESKGAYLADFLELPHGVPSHDTFKRVFELIDIESFRSCLYAHSHSILDVLCEKQIVLDGKKLKGQSPSSKGNKGLYIVNAWVAENKLCIGQGRVNDKSNEITAIPEVLREIDITDSVVTIDAIGCQKEIVSQIKEQHGHYLLAVKKNQKDLFEDIECAFKANKAITSDDDWEYAKGRKELRKCSILSADECLLAEVFQAWEGLKTIVKIESTRIIEQVSNVEIRYYISDQEDCSPQYFSSLSRGHWGIENQLHWHLDVTFKEDACRVRTANAPENLSTLRKLALQIITHTNDKLSMKKRRVKAAFDIEYLKKLVK